MAYKLENIPFDYVKAIHFNGGRYSVSALLEKHIVGDYVESDYDDFLYSLELTEPEAWELVEAWDDEGGLTNVSGYCNAYFYDNLISKIV